MREEDTWRVIAKLRENDNQNEYTSESDIKTALDGLSFENEKPERLSEIKEAIIRCVGNGTLSLTAESKEGSDGSAPVVALNPTLTSSTMYYVVFPIQSQSSTNEHETEPSKYQICWQSIPGVVKATGGPKLNTGFQQVDYPTKDYNPAIRIGLEGLKEVSITKPADGTAEQGRILQIPLRNPRDSEDKFASLKLLKDNKIYLIGTNYPKQGLQVAVGEVITLVAEKDKTDNSNYMDIVFYDDFKPCEGYTYDLNFQFKLKEDASPTDASPTGTCTIGSLTFPMHIVPKYQKWIGGGETDNWNDDSKWVRSTVEELRKEEQNSDGYENYKGDLNL